MCILYAWITLINLLEEKHEYYGSCTVNLGQLVSTDKMNHIQFGLHGRIILCKIRYRQIKISNQSVALLITL